MGYVAVKGGTEAVLNAEQLVEYFRLKGKSEPISVRQIQDQMRLAVDRAMSEGSLYAPDLAALALKQSEGDALEASFLLRAYRSTVPRIGYSLPAEGLRMRLLRRISATFKDIPGGQILGPSRDYQLRLLNRLLLDESSESIQSYLAQIEAKIDAVPSPVEVAHPLTGEPVEIGELMATECEMVSRVYAEGEREEQGAPVVVEESLPKFGLGYGFCFGHNEVKAMSMSMLDRVLSAAKESGVHGEGGPAANEEFVLLHSDGIESSGFTAHYKLPHYVSFQSDISVLERAREYRAAKFAEAIEQRQQAVRQLQELPGAEERDRHE